VVTQSNPVKHIRFGESWDTFQEAFPYLAVSFRSFQEAGCALTNQTTPLHPFRGSIVRDYFPDLHGSWYVTTHGTGNSPIPGMDLVNEKTGPSTFEKVDEACQEFVEGN